MKKIVTLVYSVTIAALLQAQSLSPAVISTAGDYSTGSGVSLSWTLGEIATETYDNGSYILTQGFQQPLEGISIAGIDLDLLVFLEGPYSGSEMGTSLNTTGVVPLSQPYTAAPWNYSGSESVPALPNADVVDWVLVELRDAATASAATPATRIARQAAFLLKDGSVVGTDGSSVLQFANSFSQQLFVIVWHRNHLGIMSANGVTETAGTYAYDFSVSESQVYGGSTGYKNLSGGVWGMVAGDNNHDGLIDLNDKAQWTAIAGQNGYLDTDFSMDTQVNNQDKDDLMLSNTSKTQQVPE